MNFSQNWEKILTTKSKGDRSRMNEIIKVASTQIAGNEAQSVNARDLHSFLGIGKVFGTWITERIQQYGFEEAKDFEVFTNLAENASRGRPSKEYMISLDMAKELSMVERNEKGKQARQYFIECERRVKAGSNPIEVLNNPEAMRGLLLSYTEKVITLEHVVKEQAPKVAFHDQVAVAPDAITMAEAAKLLGTGRNRLMSRLRQQRWLTRHNEPYQDKIEAGLMDVKLSQLWKHPDQGLKNSVTPLLTGKGLTHLRRAFAKGTVAA